VIDPCRRWHARLCAYIIREHRRGRPLTEILDDRFVAAHASRAAIAHLLSDPRFIRRLADDCRDFPRLAKTPPAMTAHSPAGDVTRAPARIGAHRDC
jgi:hypothetical protein